MSTPDNNPVIRFDSVVKRFGAVEAVSGVDLSIQTGEFFSLLGPSGCGKTTLLRMLAGFEEPSGGRVLIGGADMAGVPPYARPVNMMFQSYALFPHMSVADNVAFGLKQEGRPKAEIASRVAEMLDLVQLGGFGERKPHQLSGGQRQRVALARCLVKRPRVVLLDEPLAALDRKLRQQTQFELVRIQTEVGITFVMVTHDQEEAMSMSTRIAVMDKGRVVQVGRPHEIYEYPADRHVATFIGSANLFEGVVEAVSSGTLTIRAEGLDQPLTASGDHPVGTRLAVMLRPEKIALSREGSGFAGTVAGIAYHGDVSLYQVRLNSGLEVQVTAANLRHSAEPAAVRGNRVVLSWHSGHAVILP